MKPLSIRQNKEREGTTLSTLGENLSSSHFRIFIHVWFDDFSFLFLKNIVLDITSRAGDNNSNVTSEKILRQCAKQTWCNYTFFVLVRKFSPSVYMYVTYVVSLVYLLKKKVTSKIWRKKICQNETGNKYDYKTNKASNEKKLIYKWKVNKEGSCKFHMYICPKCKQTAVRTD